MHADPGTVEKPSLATPEDRRQLWVHTPCALCGSSDSSRLLDIPFTDAPGAVSHVVRCSQCGLRRLDPRPGPLVIGYYYSLDIGYNAFANRRRSPRAQRVWDFLRDCFSAPPGCPLHVRLAAPVAAPIADWLFDINVPINNQTGLRVLEVGSGFGDILLYLRSRGCSVLGTDLSPAAAETARQNGIEVRVSNFKDLQLPASSFDAAILSHSLEHVPDPNVELAELHRVLTPGGHLHIAVPNGAATRLQTDGKDWIHLSHPYHFWYFAPEHLVSLVQRHGFELVQPPVTTTRHHAWGWWKTEVRRGAGLQATARMLHYLRESLYNPEGGDVLRLVCRRR